MFDNFDAFQIVDKQNFIFNPTKFEVWEGGEAIMEGDCLTQIRGSVLPNTQVEVSLFNSEVSQYLNATSRFDEFITQHDRLQLVVIPKITNIQNAALSLLLMVVGPTRNEKDFLPTEPFVCSLFTKDRKFAKISFTLGNPERLIEFIDERIV